MKKVLTVVAVVLVLCAFAEPAWCQLEGSTSLSVAGTNAGAVEDFLKRLQEAVAHDQREVVSGLVEYPLSAWAGDRNIKVRNRREFVSNYPKIFARDLKQTIAAAKLENTWAIWQGVMLDSGRVWFRPVGPEESLRIVTINAPIGSPPTPKKKSR
jgi:hypothetical protein